MVVDGCASQEVHRNSKNSGGNIGTSSSDGRWVIASRLGRSNKQTARNLITHLNLSKLLMSWTGSWASPRELSVIFGLCILLYLGLCMGTQRPASSSASVASWHEQDWLLVMFDWHIRESSVMRQVTRGMSVPMHFACAN